MSPTARVLIGLVAGLALGILAAMSASPVARDLVSWIEPVGSLFINAIRMTVVPLVVASLIVGVAAAPDARSVGRIGGRALIVFLAILCAGAVLAALAAQPVLTRLIDPETTAGLRDSVTSVSGSQPGGATKLPTFSQWLVDLVPSNPIRAAADNSMLPLIVFSLALAISLHRVAPERRQPVIGFFQGVSDAMLVLVGWILALAPIGVFALAVPLAARMGLAAAGALLIFVALVSVLSVLFMLLVLYPLAVTVGRVPLAVFARAIAPAQAVALSSRSSLAALPAMIEGSSVKLLLPPEVTNFFLPLAASTFRAGTAVGLTTSVLFVARLYGVVLGPAQIATIIITVVLTSFSVPGIPNGSILVMVPVMLAAGIPVEGIGILLSIDTIPDMFRTTTNVTGHMTAATVVARGALSYTPAATPASTASPLTP